MAPRSMTVSQYNALIGTRLDEAGRDGNTLWWLMGAASDETTPQTAFYSDADARPWLDHGTVDPAVKRVAETFREFAVAMKGPVQCNAAQVLTNIVEAMAVMFTSTLVRTQVHHLKKTSDHDMSVRVRNSHWLNGGESNSGKSGAAKRGVVPLAVASNSLYHVGLELSGAPYVHQANRLCVVVHDLKGLVETYKLDFGNLFGNLVGTTDPSIVAAIDEMDTFYGHHYHDKAARS